MPGEDVRAAAEVVGVVAEVTQAVAVLARGQADTEARLAALERQAGLAGRDADRLSRRAGPVAESALNMGNAGS